MAGSKRKNKPIEYATSETPAPRKRAASSYWLILLLGSCATVGMTLFYASTAWPAVYERLRNDGLILLLWLASATGLGAAAMIPFAGKLQKPDGFGILTAIGLGLGLQSLLVLALGLGGALNQASAIVLLAAGAGGLALWYFRYRISSGDAGAAIDLQNLTGDARSRWRWAILTLVPLLAVALIGTMFPPGLLWKPDEPHGYDVVEYHLQVPREWYEAGRIQPLPHNAFSYFPFNVEMHYLLAMHVRGGPYAGMYLAQLMHLAMIVLSVLAAGGITSRLTGRRPVAIVLTILACCTVPWLTQLAAMAYNEGGFLLWSTLAIGWGVELLRRGEHPLRIAALTGVMAGFACGAKLTAAPEVLVAIPACCVCILLAGWLAGRVRVNLAEPPEPTEKASSFEPVPDYDGTRRVSTPAKKGSEAIVPTRTRLIAIVLTGVVGLLAFSPWLIRNWNWTGNPVFPERTATLGRGYFSDVQIERWQKAHSPQPDEMPATARIKAFTLRVIASWQFGYVLLPLGIIAIIFVREYRSVWLLAGLLGILTVFWLGMTHLQGRFYLLAVPLLAIPVGLVRWGRGPQIIVFVLLIGSCVSGWMRIHTRVVNLITGGPGTVGPLAPALAGEDLSWLTADSIEGLPKDAPLLLVGDAKAFWYPTIPTTRLRYRTIFDADTSGGRGIFEAWKINEGPAGEWILIDKAELERFEQTYQPFPPLPPGIKRLSDRPTLVPPGKLRQ